MDANGMKRKVAGLLARINENVEDLYADRIDMPSFDTRQRATWDAIEAAGPEVEAKVLRAIRQRMPATTCAV